MYEDRVAISVDGVIHESNKSLEFESNSILSQCQDLAMDIIAFVLDWSDSLFYKSLPIKYFMYDGCLTMSVSGMNQERNDSQI